jgi:replicative DNA helicase
MMRDDTDYTIKTSMAKIADNIERMMETEGGIYGLSTGFTDIDELTGGLQPGNLIVVAGSPTMGKTSFALNIAENIALKNDKSVVYFSLGMTSDELSMRLMSSLGRVNGHGIKTGRIEDDDWPRLTSSINLLAGTQLHIVDDPMLTVIGISLRAFGLEQEHGQLGLIVVDYLQLMAPTRSDDTRKEKVADITRRLKALAKELNVPVVLVSNLNRSLEQRPNKRPVCSDLSDDDALEQDADLIMFIYRDEVYNEDSPDKGIAEIIIAKQRCGSAGTVRLTFLGQYTRFENFKGVYISENYEQPKE